MATARNIIVKIFICAVLIFIGDRVVGLIMNHALNKARNGVSYKYKYLLHQAHPDIVILGSSRANHHYNTNMLQQKFNAKTINYGIDASGVLLYNIILKTLIKSHVPKLVIVDIKPDEFDGGLYINRINTFYPIMDQLELSRNDLNAISPYENFKLFFYTYRFNNAFFETLGATNGPKEDVTSDSGYSPYPVTNDVFQKSRIRDDNFDPAGLNILKDIIQECKANNIRLVVCTSPLYADVLGSRTVDETQKLCAQNGVMYLNYLNNTLVNFDQPDFYDMLHLNSKGADIFTADFISRISK